MRRKTKFTEGPINRQLARLTLPMILGLFSMVAFNLVDTFFVGKIGTWGPANLIDLPGLTAEQQSKMALAALGFTLPVVLILGAIGMGLSMGASAIISKAIGQEDAKQVRRLTVDSLFLAVVFALTFVVLGLLTMDPLFRLLGAEGPTLALVKEYMYTWYVGVTFVIVPFVGNSAIRANGDTRTPGITMTLMVLLNVALDPVFIFGLGPIPAMGVQGAALATVIARSFSLVIGLVVLYRSHMLTREVPSPSEALASWRGILYVGLPAAATNLVVPLTSALITNLVSTYGEDAVAALGVASRIDLLAIMVVVALSSVLGPFVGQNLGAKQIDRLKTGVGNSQRFGLLWGGLMLVLIWSGKSYIAALFTESPEVIENLVLYLSIVPFGYAFRCIYALDNTVLNVMHRPLIASGITISMMFGVYLPAAYLGSHLLGLEGVFAAIAIAYGAGGSASYFWVKKCIHQTEAQQVYELSSVQGT
jgi:putative MATE family efflux protein